MFSDVFLWVIFTVIALEITIYLATPIYYKLYVFITNFTYKGCLTFNLQIIKNTLLFIVNSKYPINSHRILPVIFFFFLPNSCILSQSMIALMNECVTLTRKLVDTFV